MWDSPRTEQPWRSADYRRHCAVSQLKRSFTHLHTSRGGRIIWNLGATEGCSNDLKPFQMLCQNNTRAREIFGLKMKHIVCRCIFVHAQLGFTLSLLSVASSDVRRWDYYRLFYDFSQLHCSCFSFIMDTLITAAITCCVQVFLT